jgi:hypothetical protein
MENSNEMRAWFFDNHRNIDYLGLLIDLSEIWRKFGYPTDAKRILKKQYAEQYTDKYINELSAELDKETKLWTSQGDGFDDMIKVLLKETHPITKLEKSLDFLHSLSQVKVDSSVKDFVNNMILAGAVSILESYLYEEFMRQLILDESKLNKFIENEKKIKIETDCSTEQKIKKVFDRFRGISWHNIKRVEEFYKTTLGFDLYEEFEKNNLLPITIETRHDVVHRFGNTIDGGTIMLTERDVTEICEGIMKFAKFVSEKFNNSTL